MEILGLKTYIQPSSEVRVVLQKLEIPFYADMCCERLINGIIQEGWYGWSNETVERIMAEWENFELHIHSKEL